MKLASDSFVYPGAPLDRARWILSYRGHRNEVDPRRPFAFLLEQERSAEGELLPTATIFLTNRECPWRCLMCDLWKNTTSETVPRGAIPEQIQFALKQLPAARQAKLYNSGSFFDSRAIPTEDWPEIARLVGGFERVVVECHPSLIGPACGKFREMIGGKLEVAMGLETAHRETLERLNKRMTREQFSDAAALLGREGIDLRVFILVKPPFMTDAEAAEWAKRSIDFALERHATVISLIPTRLGNGALDELARQGEFSEPTLEMLEEAHEYGISRGGARVFADLWDLRRFSQCAACFEARANRLQRMNWEQCFLPKIRRPCCA